MFDYLATIENPEMRQWYEEHWGITQFNEAIQGYINQDDGWILDQKSGLLRGRRSNAYRRYVAYPRPTHYHELGGVTESLYVSSGMGLLLIDQQGSWKECELRPGELFEIPKNTPHAFRPNERQILSLRLRFDKPLDPKADVKIIDFKQFQPWIDYYKQH